MKTEALIVGAGPVGLTVAVELARRGVDCRVVEERQAPQESTRGCTVYQRTLEIFESMGLPVDDYVAAGVSMERRVYHLFGETVGVVDMREPGSSRPYPLVIGQHITERHLEDRLRRLGIRVERGRSVARVTQDADGVDAVLRHADGGESRVRAQWLIAAQGAASGVRESLGVEWNEWRRFNGLQMLQVDARIRLPFPVAPDEAHMFFGAGGHVGCVPLPEGRHRVFAVRRDPDPADRSDPGLTEIAAAMEELCGIGDVRLSDGRYAWRVRLQNRVASRFRVGRCLLAGDSARVFAPVHAQGMNTGIQDAFNLGWKLAAIVLDDSPETLLDTYETERRPVARELLDRTERSLDFAVQEEPGREPLLAAITVNRGKRTQLAISYADSPLTRDHLGDEEGPRAGERAPDAPFAGPREPTSLFREWRQGGLWSLLLLSGPEPGGEWPWDRAQALGRGRRTQLTTIAIAPSEPATELRKIYAPSGPRFYVIRPDGHIGCRGGPAEEPHIRAYLDEVLG